MASFLISFYPQSPNSTVSWPALPSVQRQCLSAPLSQNSDIIPGGSKTMETLGSMAWVLSISLSPVSGTRKQCYFPPLLQLPALEDQLSTLRAPVIISSMTMLEKLSDTYTCFSTENGHYLYVLHLVSVWFWGPCFSSHESMGRPLASPSSGTLDSFRRQKLRLMAIPWDLILPSLSPGIRAGEGSPLGPADISPLCPQFGECLFIAINGDHTEGEGDLRQKLRVLKYLFELHFGLVTVDGQLIRKE